MLKRNLTLLFIVLLTLLNYNCKNDSKKPATPSKETKEKALIFAREIIKTADFESCQGEECPSIDVNYLVAEGNTSIAKHINKTNTEHIIGIFNDATDTIKIKSVKEAVKSFMVDYFNFKDEFPDSPAEYEAQLSQKLISETDSLLVIETNFYLFTGGAHGYGATRYLNFDAHTGNYLSHNDLFRDLDGFTAFVEKKFREKYNIPAEENINSKGFFFENDTFALPENIAVTDNEVLLVYNRYEAASYAQGELTFVFPREEVAQWLKY